MMSLFKEEFLKFFRSGFFKTVALILIVCSFILPVAEFMQFKNKVGGDYQKYKQIAEKSDGQQIETSISREELNDLFRQNINSYSVDEKIEHQLNLRKSLVAYRWNSFENYNEIDYIKVDKFYSTTGISQLFDKILSRFGTFVIAIILILISVPIFSYEKVSKMNEIISSCTRGKKEVVIIKLCVAIILSVLFVSLYYLISVCMYSSLYGDWKYFSLPAMYVTSGVNWLSVIFCEMSVLKTLCIGFLYILIGSVTTSLMLCFISIICKNIFTGFILGAVLFIVQYIFLYISSSINVTFLPVAYMQFAVIYGNGEILKSFNSIFIHFLICFSISAVVSSISFFSCKYFYSRVNFDLSVLKFNIKK